MSEETDVLTASGQAKGIDVPATIFTAVCLAVQLISFAATYRGYLRPLLALPLGMALCAGLTVWELFGFFLLCTPALRSCPALLRWPLVIFFFILPMIVFLMLGPAVATIFNALGPIIKSP